MIRVCRSASGTESMRKREEKEKRIAHAYIVMVRTHERGPEKPHARCGSSFVSL